MHFLLSTVLAISLCYLGAIAQLDGDDPDDWIWYFPFRVTLANGEGNGNPGRLTSFADNISIDMDLTGPFTLMSWLRVSDKRFWRAAISIESPDATSALFRIALPPDQMKFNVAWMQSAQARGGAINTTAVAPGPNVDFHFALVKDNNSIIIYIDGVQQSSNSLTTQIFNPQDKQVVLGRTKLDGNPNRSQWNGILRDVYVWDEALTSERILKERQDTLVE